MAEQDYGPLGMQYGQFGVQAPDMSAAGPGLAGFGAGTAFNNYQTNQGLQTLLNQMIVQANQNRLQEYGLNAGVRETGREASMATNRATTATIGRQKQGEADLSAAKGTVAQGTAQGDIAATNAQSAGKVDIEKFNQDIRDNDRFTQIAPALMGHPQGREMFKQWAKQAGWKDDNPYVKYVMDGDGSDFAQRVQNVQSHMTQNLEQQRKLQTQNLTGQWGLTETLVKENAALDRAYIQDAWRRDVAKRAQESKEKVKKIQEKVTEVGAQYFAEIEKPGANPQRIASLKAQLEYWTEVMYKERMAGAQLYPDVGIPHTRPAMPGTPPPGPQNQIPGTGGNGLPQGVTVTPRNR